MITFKITKGATSQILPISIYDSSSTTGGKLSGLVFNSAGLTGFYNRSGAAGTAVAISLATATKGTWATGGFVAIDGTNMPGDYELHIPNAALTSGADTVMIQLKGAANMVPVNVLVWLQAVDAQNATTMGLTNLDATVSSRMATYTQPTGFLAATFPTTVASTTNITAGTVTTATNVTTLNGIAANVITAASIADGAIDNATFAADTGKQTIRSNTAQAGAATTITLDASASATNSFYNNDLIMLTGGTGAGQARFITAYVGATKVATVATWATNPDATTTFAILPFDAVAGASAPTTAQIATAVWTDLLASSDFSTASSIGILLKNDIDAAISSRMATYTQPTGFLAATFPTTVASTSNITAATGVVLSGVTHTGAVIPTVSTITNRVTANTDQINGIATAAVRLGRSTQAIVTGTVGAASTTTSIVTSALDPVASVTDQFKGRIVTFDQATTTAALRGQATDITASTAGGVLTVTALTTAAVSGDSFTIT